MSPVTLVADTRSYQTELIALGALSSVNPAGGVSVVSDVAEAMPRTASTRSDSPTSPIAVARRTWSPTFQPMRWMDGTTPSMARASIPSIPTAWPSENIAQPPLSSVTVTPPLGAPSLDRRMNHRWGGAGWLPRPSQVSIGLSRTGDSSAGPGSSTAIDAGRVMPGGRFGSDGGGIDAVVEPVVGDVFVAAVDVEVSCDPATAVCCGPVGAEFESRRARTVNPMIRTAAAASPIANRERPRADRSGEASRTNAVEWSSPPSGTPRIVSFEVTPSLARASTSARIRPLSVASKTTSGGRMLANSSTSFIIAVLPRADPRAAVVFGGGGNARSRSARRGHLRFRDRRAVPRRTSPEVHGHRWASQRRDRSRE